MYRPCHVVSLLTTRQSGGGALPVSGNAARACGLTDDRSIRSRIPHQYSRSHCLLHGCHTYQYRWEGGTARKGGGCCEWLRFTQLKASVQDESAPSDAPGLQ